jgi:hypothetical protein
MRPDPRFVAESKAFWANVRSISQTAGYTAKKTRTVKVYSIQQMAKALAKIGLETSHILQDGEATPLGKKLVEYFQYRADVLNTYVEPRLMNVDRAREVFEDLRQQVGIASICPVPRNKQKGEKAGPAYLTGIVNTLVERHTAGLPVDYNPLALTTVTYNGAPLRTLSRRLDGAFPRHVDPIAVWEIKEYYHTRTFGSRIADGVYETQLDGMELAELEENERITVQHILIVDAYYTWWQCGRSYLCRLVDMLHMGYVREVLFGFEVVERLPEIVQEWVEEYHRRV